MQSKLPNNAAGIISSMGALIGEYGAVDLAYGKTDFPCPDELVSLAAGYVKSASNQHSPAEGLLRLRELIAGRINELYGYSFDPVTELTIASGGTQAVHTAITAVVRDDDEVIVFEPACELYIPSILMNNGKPVYAQLKQPGFKVDWEELRKMITSKTRMIIIDSPQNPSGRVFSEEDMLQLQRLTNGTNIIILSSEVYKNLVYDNIIHQSVARFEKLIRRSLIVSSLEPLYNLNGWGLAYCIGPEGLMSEFRNVQQIQLSPIHVAFQYAMADYLEDNYPLDDIVELFQGKRNYFNRLMSKSLFKVLPAQGGYFELLDYSAVSDEPDLVFAERLVREHRVAVLPVSVFLHDKTRQRLLRICFAKTNETLELAAERLLKVSSVL
ncbi:MAG: aminotransferase class I/II-fold pyridoxal phosphate-dependent enzyme [Mangrovibacterium sp.]